MAIVVLVPWTYDNIGSEMSDSSVLLNLPYEQFAHTIADESTIAETLSISSDIGDVSSESGIVEKIKTYDLITAFPTFDFYSPLFVNSSLGDCSSAVNVEETVSMSEELSPQPWLFDHRFLSVYDTYVESNNGEEVVSTNAEREPVTILSDVEISYQPEYSDEFKNYANHKSPLGYSTLRPLYPGDYEYQDAIVGIQVDLTPPVSGRFGVAGATLHIDVQDVVDKGTEIFDENRPYQGRTRVWFTKKFYSRPNVFTEVRNANPPCRVNVLAVDTRGVGSDSSHSYGYFDFELLNFTDGTEWSGDVTIAWNAIGY